MCSSAEKALRPHTYVSSVVTEQRPSPETAESSAARVTGQRPSTGRAQASPELAWLPLSHSSHVSTWLGRVGPVWPWLWPCLQRDKLAWGQAWRERRRPRRWRCHWYSLRNKVRFYKSVCLVIQKQTLYMYVMYYICTPTYTHSVWICVCRYIGSTHMKSLTFFCG